MKRSKTLIAIVLCAILTVTLFSGCSSNTQTESTPPSTAPESAAQESAAPEKEMWKPERAVNVYCWAGAGGMTDLQSRAMAKGLEEAMGVPFQVTNVTGGGGAVAANQVLSMARDGYTILGMSEGIHGIPVLGGFDKTSDDFSICMSIGAEAVISVPADSPYQTIEDLVAAAATKELKAASSQAGSIWSVKLGQFMQATGTSYNKLSYEGSAASHVAALNGEVDLVLTAISEQKEYILAGKLRPLVIIEQDGVDLEGVGYIRSLGEVYPAFMDLPVAMQWVGMGIPADTAPEIIEAYEAAWKQALDSSYMSDLIETLGCKKIALVGDDAKDSLHQLNSVFMWALYDNGLAQISPETYNIPKA